MKRYIVIGSGPSGLVATHYLLKKGHQVTMLDFGNKRIGDDYFQFDDYITNDNRDELVGARDFNWKDRKKSKESLSSDWIKSQYFYADSAQHILGGKINAVANVSLAMGGLSNLWGGAVLPPMDEDIDAWPIRAADLKPFYDVLTEIMPLSSVDDRLSSVFDFRQGQPHNFPLGPQAVNFLEDLEASGADLKERGIHFGRAKLAIDPRVPIDNQVRHPFGPIFNAAIALKRHRENTRFDYIPHVLVQEIEEHEGGVNVVAQNARGSSTKSFSGHKAVLACGVIGTTQIVARSGNDSQQKFELKTNQNFFFPFLRYKRLKGVSQLDTNSIPQLFLEIRNQDTFDRFAHIQVYQYGDYVAGPIRSIAKGLTPFVLRAARPVLERIMIMQGMLHSDFSDHVTLKLSQSDGWKVHIEGKKNPKTELVYKGLLRSLAQNRSLLRGIPLKSALMVDPPGASNHLGGTIPMSANPGVKETDLWGVPAGFKKVHIVDSTILPSLPAPTLTFSVMANAARICDYLSREHG